MPDESYIPIVDYDPEPIAVIEPVKVYRREENFPRKAILIFYQEIIDDLRKKGKIVELHVLKSEVGHLTAYEMIVNNESICIFNPGLGGPSAGGFTEELIAKGVEKIIACGSCGVLDKSIPRGKVIVLDSAVRDEGFSYHYLPPSTEVTCSPEIVEIIETVLTEEKADFMTGKTWTTDAFFRETEKRVVKMKGLGCIVVEMEAAALMALSEFRKIKFGQILSTGDDVSGKEWDSRNFGKVYTHKELLFSLALKCIQKI